MKAIREYLKVKDHKLIFELPENFDYDEVEIIILPRDKKTTFWSNSEIKKIGKIGFDAKSFDYKGN